MEWRKEMFLFKYKHNTLYLGLFGIRCMVKDRSVRKNILPPRYGLFFLISSKGSFICTIPQTMAFVIPDVEQWLKRDTAQWAHHEGLIQWPIAPWVNNLPQRYTWLPFLRKTYLRVHILSSFGHTCSRAQALACQVTVSEARGGSHTHIHLVYCTELFTHTAVTIKLYDVMLTSDQSSIIGLLD